MAEQVLSLPFCFKTLKDHRVTGRCDHRMIEIVAIAICAVICGADYWQHIEAFGKKRHDWLKRFLKLPNGIPSHDTFERFFQRLDPIAFQRCFSTWAQHLAKSLGLPHIAIDGKTLRGSGGKL